MEKYLGKDSTEDLTEACEIYALNRLQVVYRGFVHPRTTAPSSAKQGLPWRVSASRGSVWLLAPFFESAFFRLHNGVTKVASTTPAASSVPAGTDSIRGNPMACFLLS